MADRNSCMIYCTQPFSVTVKKPHRFRGTSTGARVLEQAPPPPPAGAARHAIIRHWIPKKQYNIET